MFKYLPPPPVFTMSPPPAPLVIDPEDVRSMQINSNECLRNYMKLGVNTIQITENPNEKFQDLLIIIYTLLLAFFIITTVIFISIR
jgi:hypothetical protein